MKPATRQLLHSGSGCRGRREPGSAGGRISADSLRELRAGLVHRGRGLLGMGEP